MDEGGKRTDQELFEALILIRSDFDHLCSSGGLIVVAHSGRSSGPEEESPACPSFVRGVRKNGWSPYSSGQSFGKGLKKLLFIFFLIIISPAFDRSVENPEAKDKR